MVALRRSAEVAHVARRSADSANPPRWGTRKIRLGHGEVGRLEVGVLLCASVAEGGVEGGMVGKRWQGDGVKSGGERCMDLAEADRVDSGGMGMDDVRGRGNARLLHGRTHARGSGRARVEV